MTYDLLRQELIEQAHLTKSNLDSYRLKRDANSSYIAKQQRLLDAISQFIEAADATSSPNDDLITVIKKQALIISAAHIVYPTINQSMGYLYDCYLKSQGRDEEIGQDHKTINVQISIL